MCKSNTFVPERYGINQKPKNYRLPEPLPIEYDAKKDSSNSNNRTVFSKYHPKSITTMLPIKNANINSRHRHYFDNIHPFIKHSNISSYYVIMKPWSPLDVRLSQETHYWSIYPQNATVINYLFNVSIF